VWGDKGCVGKERGFQKHEDFTPAIDPVRRALARKRKRDSTRRNSSRREGGGLEESFAPAWRSKLRDESSPALNGLGWSPVVVWKSWKRGANDVLTILYAVLPGN